MLKLPEVDEPAGYNTNDLYHWNHVALELNRMTHSLGGPQSGPTMSSRALGILHLAMHDAWFGVRSAEATAAGFSTYLDPAATGPYQLPPVPSGGDAHVAMAAAAIAVLQAFYGNITAPAISEQTALVLAARVARAIRDFRLSLATAANLPSADFGAAVGKALIALLAVKPGEPGADPGTYMPPGGRYGFGDDPSHPVKLVPVDPNEPEGPQQRVPPWHGPLYGATAKRMATQTPNHLLADPPKALPGNLADEYNDAVRDVVAMGGAPGARSTVRTPDQTAAALFWAYDGANLIGTPPRLYNQIVRKLAWEKKTGAPTDAAVTDEFVRLFALVNVAMADAGVFSWSEKYRHTFWRPLTGVREHDAGSGPAHAGQVASAALAPDADPFWLALGAPETNTHKLSFKPPFPAYPSGHATFGAAAFQMLRLHYKKRDGLTFDDGCADDIGFDFVSEELNGKSRDLYQPYKPRQELTDQPGLVRTRIVRHFPSLWAAIFENAISRIWLGVHWRFDAFGAEDVLVGKAAPYDTDADGRTLYKPVKDITYRATGPRGGSGQFPIGGVPLGLGIANDIFTSGMKPTPADQQPPPAAAPPARPLPPAPPAPSPSPPSAGSPPGSPSMATPDVNARVNSSNTNIR